MSATLVLHAVRLLGFADMEAVAARFGLPVGEVVVRLTAAESGGLVQHGAFAEASGWSLTEAGKAENERLLAAELDDACRATVVAAHAEFLPLNARLLRAVTDWQLRTSAGRLTPNDHGDASWDARVLRELGDIGNELGPIQDSLEAALPRFAGYRTRFVRALYRASPEAPEWVDRTDRESCHRVWFELHEDLVATLGIDRATSA